MLKVTEVKTLIGSVNEDYTRELRRYTGLFILRNTGAENVDGCISSKASWSLKYLYWHESCS
jgi:hypothetical protein